MWAILAGLLSASPSYAATEISLSWDFTTGGTNSGFTYGNTRTFETEGGPDVVVSAYATSQILNVNSTFRDAYLGQYTNGLGVSANPFDLSHTVDNLGHVDLVVFEFKHQEEVKATSFKLSAFGDTDIAVWGGTLAANFDFTGQTFATLNTLLTSYGVVNGGTSDRIATIPDGRFGNYLVVAADPTLIVSKWQRHGISESDDSFKLGQLDGNFIAASVPEPSTWAMMLIGFAGLALACRRKTRLQPIASA
jgi:PEP-CTERM motif